MGMNDIAVVASNLGAAILAFPQRLSWGGAGRKQVGLVIDGTELKRRHAVGLGRLDAVTQAASIKTLGARSQFRIALVLTILFPVLTVVSLIASGVVEVKFVSGHGTVILLAVAPVIFLGYWLLARYPRTVVDLRRSLERIASGELPDEVLLPDDEDDISAITACLSMILQQTRTRLETIRKQHEELIAAERDKVALESMGAACHHIGQPAAALLLYMGMIEKERANLPQNVAVLLADIRSNVEQLCDILNKMQSLSAYKTVPYLSAFREGKEQNILDIDAA